MKILLPREEAAEALSVSVRVFDCLVQSGQAPKPRKISPRRVGWLRSELEKFAAGLPVSDIPPPPNTGLKRKA